MKTWWMAACDEHKELCPVIVNNPAYTAIVLEDHREDIHQWLSLHYNCKLRLIHHDFDLDECYDKKYKDII